MAATRRNILSNATDAQRFVQAVLALKAEPTNLRTTDLGIDPGPRATARDLSTWDLFVVWHVWAMEELSNDGRRNAAHRGPVFLPWHRWFMLVLEAQMQRVLGVGRDDFGLPYWDWAADGTNRSPAEQRTSAPVWAVIGGNGRPGDRVVTDGPFTPTAGFDVAVEQGPTGRLRATDRALRRDFGTVVDRLPQNGDVAAAMSDDRYDRPDWDSATDSFRNKLEGWVPRDSAPALHNRVHVWVGGDMLPGSSPNDPVFFLNHCNVDRIWEEWRQADARHQYQPTGRSGPDDPLFRHRALDPIHSILTSAQPQVAAMEDVSTFYIYG
jgi:tyrosinase